jgi:hypothetical protein
VLEAGTTAGGGAVVAARGAEVPGTSGMDIVEINYLKI